mmetsp:Transcript_33976/g.80463  ORF Transcript_33976/g.80463 Transcript_33976/m.80463 type:complete len:311 (+) Transcript_33976:630-1562(+)
MPKLQLREERVSPDPAAGDALLPIQVGDRAAICGHAIARNLVPVEAVDSPGMADLAHHAVRAKRAQCALVPQRPLVPEGPRLAHHSSLPALPRRPDVPRGAVHPLPALGALGPVVARGPAEADLAGMALHALGAKLSGVSALPLDTRRAHVALGALGADDTPLPSAAAVLERHRVDHHRELLVHLLLRRRHRGFQLLHPSESRGVVRGKNIGNRVLVCGGAAALGRIVAPGVAVSHHLRHIGVARAASQHLEHPLVVRADRGKHRAVRARQPASRGAHAVRVHDLRHPDRRAPPEQRHQEQACPCYEQCP